MTKISSLWEGQICMLNQLDFQAGWLRRSNEVLDLMMWAKKEWLIPPGRSYLSRVSIDKDRGAEWLGRRFRFWVEGNVWMKVGKFVMHLRFLLVWILMIFSIVQLVLCCLTVPQRSGYQPGSSLCMGTVVFISVHPACSTEPAKSRCPVDNWWVGEWARTLQHLESGVYGDGPVAERLSSCTLLRWPRVSLVRILGTDMAPLIRPCWGGIPHATTRRTYN